MSEFTLISTCDHNNNVVITSTTKPHSEWSCTYTLSVLCLAANANSRYVFSTRTEMNIHEVNARCKINEMKFSVWPKCDHRTKEREKIICTMCNMLFWWRIRMNYTQNLFISLYAIFSLSLSPSLCNDCIYKTIQRSALQTLRSEAMTKIIVIKIRKRIVYRRFAHTNSELIKQ